jgi:putative ABC transport system permease protein
MRMLRQILVEATGNLASAKQRTLLALIGIIIGTGSVIAMINIGTIVQDEALRQFRELGTNIINAKSAPSQVNGFVLSDVLALPAKVPMVETVAPSSLSGGNALLHGRGGGVSIVGATQSLAEIAKLSTAQGRFLSNFDANESYAVVGAQFMGSFPGDPKPLLLGDQIAINGQVFTVLGVLRPVPFNTLFPVDFNNTMIIPLNTMRRIVAGAPINSLMIRLSSDLHVDETVAQINQYFAPETLGAALDIHTAEQLIGAMQKQMQLFTLMLGSIGSISLLVGGIGVMNVMLVSVTERRQEIGIRLAIGARRFDIQLLFLVESVLLSIIGGALGTGLGVGASALIAKLSGWQFVLSQSAVPLGAGVSIAVGVFFGFYPAVIASRLNPIEALRST